MTRSVAVVVLALFLAGVLAYVARHAAKLFAPRYGRSHRLVAGAYLLWLVAGAARCFGANEPATAVDAAAYDAVLGVLGTLTALTAARDFGQHATAKTSGTLDADAFVTRSEMVEHAFYQVLNFLQIMGLHALAAGAPGFAVLLAQTLPWAWRARFPVNSFSANYDAARGGGSPWALTNVMYRIKKYQYIFYKHALLHGLNISAALGRPPRIRGRRFRAYWLSLNAARGRAWRRALAPARVEGVRPPGVHARVLPPDARQAAAHGAAGHVALQQVPYGGVPCAQLSSTRVGEAPPKKSGGLVRRRDRRAAALRGLENRSGVLRAEHAPPRPRRR